MRESFPVEKPTETLHRLTSYEPGREWDEVPDDPRVLRNFVPNDPDRFPWFFKRYSDELPRVSLPTSLPNTSEPAVPVLAGSERIPKEMIDLNHLARLLYLSSGIVRTSVRPNGKTFLYRAAGSAGSRFPLELYVAIPEGTSLPAGVHWYHPQEHALYQVGPAPGRGAPSIVVTGVPWRTGWRYRERGYRHVYWDAGTMLAQLLALANSAGITARLHTRFPDASVGSLVGADEIHEWPLAVVALDENAPALDATGEATRGEVDAAPMEFPLITAAQRAGEMDGLGRAWEPGVPVDVPDSDDRPVEEIVLARGSQRLMDATRPLPEKVLAIATQVATRGISVPHWAVVHNVDGVTPGVYKLPDLTKAIRSGDLRAELYRVCLEQGLCSDAAFVVIGATDVSKLDDREYREAQLAAGLVEGRLHLLAYALGASASGMTFLDSEIAPLLGEEVDGLLFTCVGVPEYRSAPAGLPGDPKAVRVITPRLG